MFQWKTGFRKGKPQFFDDWPGLAESLRKIQANSGNVLVALETEADVATLKRFRLTLKDFIEECFRDCSFLTNSLAMDCAKYAVQSVDCIMTLIQEEVPTKRTCVFTGLTEGVFYHVGFAVADPLNPHATAITPFYEIHESFRVIVDAYRTAGQAEILLMEKAVQGEESYTDAFKDLSCCFLFLYAFIQGYARIRILPTAATHA